MVEVLSFVLVSVKIHLWPWQSFSHEYSLKPPGVSLQTTLVAAGAGFFFSFFFCINQHKHVGVKNWALKSKPCAWLPGLVPLAS